MSATALHKKHCRHRHRPYICLQTLLNSLCTIMTCDIVYYYDTNPYPCKRSKRKTDPSKIGEENRNLTFKLMQIRNSMNVKNTVKIKMMLSTYLVILMLLRTTRSFVMVFDKMSFHGACARVTDTHNAVSWKELYSCESCH